MTTPSNLGVEAKAPADLNPPKDDPISAEYLSKCNGNDSNYPVYVAVKGRVFDVTGNNAYAPNGPYHVFAGKDASRALAMSSTKAADVRPDWTDLGDKEKGVLNEWFNFFNKRYNIVGRVTGASNL
ncbi:MAG: hypothetical protein M1816_005016 [Peltula sp. TS41687]|nr:MAG: hypothetical protein M1816_005016 [Peltula sp. TS41687]